MNKTLKTIDRSAKTITVSKDFLMKAGLFGTPEFYEAIEMKAKGYTLLERQIKRNPDKRKYGNLTYDVMASFIGAYEADSESKLAEFEAVKKWAKTQTAAYAKVKNWFLDHYGTAFKAQSNSEGTEKDSDENS